MILLCLCVATINAQTYYYTTTEFAYKQKINGQWTDWSDWEKSNMLLYLFNRQKRTIICERKSCKSSIFI